MAMANSGFSKVLKRENPSKFILILAEDGPGLYTLNYITELLRNLADSESNNAVTLLSFAFRSLTNFGNIKIFDFIRTNFPGLEALYSDLRNNLNPAKRNFLILDDLALLCIQNDRKSKEICHFFKQLSSVYSQIILFCHVDTVSKELISLLCNFAEDVVILKNNNVDDNYPEFICNHVTIKPSGKISLNQTCFKVENGAVIDVENKIVKENASTSSEDVMKSLTTFKLTIEDSEKESKNRLHLPYLDAQKTTVSDPSEDFYDDDEEDEDD